MPHYFERTCSILPLALFRIGFGLLMFISTVRFVAKGWVTTLYIEPPFHFSYYGFGWLEPLPGPLLYLLFGLMGVAALGIALGLFYRLSIVTFFLSFTYVELLDKAYYLNHYYLVSILAFLCIWLPLNRHLSVDAFRNPSIRAQAISCWMRDLLRVQLGLVYFYAGLAKLQPDWMFDAMPMKIWLYARADMPNVGPLFATEWMPYLMSWGGAVYDLTIPFFLLYRPTRPYAFTAVIGFHLATSFLFPPIGIFPYLMIVSSILFFDGDELTAIKRRFRPSQADKSTNFIHSEAQSQDSITAATPIGSRSSGRHMPQFVLYLLVIFLLCQAVVPLRHYAYSGDVLWTEDGFRYAWKVMIVEKRGQTIYNVTDPETGKSWPIYPDLYLTDFQTAQMAYQPDMIWEFAQFVETEMANRGFKDVEVRAESYVSYNGKPSRLLIDPTVDLTEVENTLWPKSWILQ